MPRTLAYIGVGSNIDAEHHVLLAVGLLREQMEGLRASTFYWTEPIGRPEQHPYLNGVLAGTVSTSAVFLKEGVLQEIERRLGRVRCSDRYAPRSIDLDILLFGEEVLRGDSLQVPDPDLRTRSFLVEGCCELNPGLLLPDTGEALAGLLQNERRALKAAVEFTRQVKELLNE